MSKTDFLHKLEERLQMLNASEREDIVSEYSQHIDMKVKDGLSEEQAIKDFGEFDGLIAEILEAYHFNPQFAAESKLQKELSGIASEAKKVSKGAFAWLTAIFCGCGKIADSIIEKIRGYFTDAVQRIRPRKAGLSEKKIEKNTNEVFSKTGGACMKLMKKLLSLALAVLKACVYIGVFCALCMVIIPVIFMGLLALFGIGVSAVLLYGGYPMAGILIGCTGGFLCCASFTAFALSLLIRGGSAEKQMPQTPVAKPKAVPDIELQGEN